jgi:hypothetical protein
VNLITSYNEGYTASCPACSEILVKVNLFVECALGFSMPCLRDTVFIMALLYSCFPTDAQRKHRVLVFPRGGICKVRTEYLQQQLIFSNDSRDTLLKKINFKKYFLVVNNIRRKCSSVKKMGE